MGIIEKVNAVVKLVKDLGNVELLSEIVDLKHEIVDIEEQNLNMRQKISELEEALRTKANLELSDNAYWMKKEGEWDGPFCTGCWDDKRKLMRLTREPGGVPSCPVCKRRVDEHVYPPDYPEHKKKKNSSRMTTTVRRNRSRTEGF